MTETSEKSPDSVEELESERKTRPSEEKPLFQPIRTLRPSIQAYNKQTRKTPGTSFYSVTESRRNSALSSTLDLTLGNSSFFQDLKPLAKRISQLYKSPDPNSC